MARPNVKQLNYIRMKDAKLSEALDDLINAHTNVSDQLASDPNGKDVIPPKIGGVQAQASGGLVDVTIADGGQISRAITYHVEYSPDANFSNPRGAELGSWRNHTLYLPNGLWYVRAYSQYKHGGAPSFPVSAPAPVLVTGSVSLSLLPGQGSGTGKANSGGGQGAGKAIRR